ncbi:unnamed protein product [Ixodes pacificus]
MLLCMDQGKDYKVDILRAVFFLDQAWRQISASTIANCFRHAGFASTLQDPSIHDLPPVEHEDLAEEEDEDLLEQFSVRGVSFDFDEYVHIDNDVATCSENTVESIIAEICNEESEEEAEIADDEVAEPAVTAQQVDSALQALKSFFFYKSKARNSTYRTSRPWMTSFARRGCWILNKPRSPRFFLLSE